VTEEAPPPSPRGRAVRDVVLFFLRLGLTAFGGPAAHIAMMEQEVVRRRAWLTERNSSTFSARRTSSPVQARPSWQSSLVTGAQAGPAFSLVEHASSFLPR